MQANHPHPQPTLGIGACLAGNAVRYNGETKRANQYVTDICEHFSMRAFCPEVTIGMGVPRAPIHLVGSEDSVRVLDVDSHSRDYTDELAACATTVLEQWPELCGYILVKGSPSCGYERVKRFADSGHKIGADQQGVFAAALSRLDPLLPVEDDGRLNDPQLRESFVVRAVTYHEWKLLCAQERSAGRLIAFYSRFKYLLMAHHVPTCKAVGRLLADAGEQPVDELYQSFIELLMRGLGQPATRRTHSNVLYHIMGYLKRDLPAVDRQRLAELIEQYRQGIVPLVVPITLLSHHFTHRPDAYIQQQVYMAPCPDTLKLRTQL